MKAQILNEAANAYLNFFNWQLNKEQNEAYLYLYNNIWKEVFLHEKDREVFFSQYEKTQKYSFPPEIATSLFLLKTDQEEEYQEEEEQEEEQEEQEEENFKTIDKKNLFFWLCIVWIIIIVCTFLLGKKDIQVEKDKFDIITTAEHLVDEKINQEVRLQEKLNQELKDSFDRVRKYKKEKENFYNQKIGVINKLQ